MRGAPAGGIQAANDLRDLREPELFVAGIFALGRESQPEIANDVFVFLTRGDGAAQAASFQDGQDQLFRGTGISCGFENDELSFLQVWVNGESCLLDVTQIGFAALIKGRGNANQDGVALFELGKIRGGAEVAADDELLNLILGNVLDVGAAGI